MQSEPSIRKSIADMTLSFGKGLGVILGMSSSVMNRELGWLSVLPVAFSD